MGSDKELNSIIHILCRKESCVKKNCLLISNVKQTTNVIPGNMSTNTVHKFKRLPRPIFQLSCHTSSIIIYVRTVTFDPSRL